MNCCTECFVSPNLKDKINREKAKGDCDFCLRIGVSVMDARALFPSFELILNQYYPSVDGALAEEQLTLDFPDLIFSDISPDTIKSLLHSVFEDHFTTYESLLKEKIVLSCRNNPAYDEDITSLKLTWEAFVTEIKSENRFHIKSVLDSDKLQRILATNTVSLNKGKYFYRGRISEKNEVFPIGEMSNPPKHLAKSGRANPVGISYLYVANDRKTTLFETRATLHDYVCIGEFTLKEDIRVIDLKDIGKQDPFDLGENDLLNDYLAYLPFLQSLGSELSKPIRRGDSELDYLPTQYLTEFIKTTEVDGIAYDGVAYGSSLNGAGHNLVIFYPEKIECLKVELYEITSMSYEFNQLV